MAAVCGTGLSVSERDTHIQIFLVSCAAAAVSIWTPVVFGEIVEVLQSLKLTQVVSNVALARINKPSFKLMCLFVANGLLTFTDISLVSVLGEKLAKSLRMRLYSSYLHQSIAFYDDKMHGELLSRLTQDISDFKVYI